MKHSLIFLIMLVATLAHAQESAPAFTREQLVKKSKGQLIAGVVVSVAGCCLVWAGINQAANKMSNDIYYSFSPLWGEDPQTSGSDGTVLTVAGFACVAASIPLYIASGRNSTKARKMQTGIQMQRAPLLNTNGVVHRISYPVISVRIRL